MEDLLLILVLVIIAVLWYVVVRKYEAFMRKNYKGKRRFKDL